MDEINNENKKCVIMGDMNINMLNYGAHNQTDTYVDGIFSRGFLPRIIMPTRVTHRSATLIDHILTNEITSASSSGIIINDVADHFAIFNISTTTPNKPKPQIRHIRSFSEENITKFKSELDLIDFSPVLQIDCPNEAYSTFINLYKQPFDIAFPLRTIKVGSRHIKREPWMTAGLLNSSRHKSKLLLTKFKKGQCTIK